MTDKHEERARKWLDDNPDPGYAQVARLVAAVERETDEKWEREAIKALFYLRSATPRQRNGPCIQAITVLRMSLGLGDTWVMGQDALDGIPQEHVAWALSPDRPKPKAPEGE